MSNLHAQILSAHAAGDGKQLVELYTRAADRAETVDEECFFLVAAYVFALETAHPSADQLRQRLVAHGREQELEK